MIRLSALLLVCLVSSACGPHTAVPLLSAPMQAPTVRLSADSVRGAIRGTIQRFLAKAHPTMTLVEKDFTVSETVRNGKRAFSAIGVSPRQRRRIAGHYDVATQTATVESDILAP